jgi:hypothetical protein
MLSFNILGAGGYAFTRKSTLIERLLWCLYDLKQNGASIHSFHLPYKLGMACKVALISA